MLPWQKPSCLQSSRHNPWTKPTARSFRSRASGEARPRFMCLGGCCCRSATRGARGAGPWHGALGAEQWRDRPTGRPTCCARRTSALCGSSRVHAGPGGWPRGGGGVDPAGDRLVFRADHGATSGCGAGPGTSRGVAGCTSGVRGGSARAGRGHGRGGGGDPRRVRGPLSGADVALTAFAAVGRGCGVV